MKHLFVTHSGITAVVARLTIEYLELDLEDVVILTGRGQSNDSGSAGMSIEAIPLTFRRNVVRFRRELTTFDQKIQGLVRSAEFTAYLPGLYTEQLYALSSHRLCRTTAFIEEGAGSYTPSTRRYSRRRNERPITAYIAGLGRFPRHHANQSERLGSAYCVSPEAFPDWPVQQKHVLAFHGDGATTQPCPFDVIIATETIVERSRGSLAEYNTALTRSLSMLRVRGFRRFGVKFHPNNSELVRQGIGATLAEIDPTVEVVAPHVQLEKWMGVNGPLFLGTTSSVLHYAVLWGGRAASMCDLFEGRRLPEYFESVLPESSRLRIERLNSTNTKLPSGLPSAVLA